MTNAIQLPRPAVAVIGSTGNCGHALIQQLLQQERFTINAYCRNKIKLLNQQRHAIEEKEIVVFEGNINDSSLIAECCRKCRAVFVVASTNDNVPGCHVTQDIARSIVDAFKILQHEPGSAAALPKVLLLSSSTIDEHLSRHMGFFKHIMSRAASHVYEDLRQGEKILRREEDWINTVYIKPGGLSHDIKRGHQLSVDEDETFVSYQDLAAGMIEVAEDSCGQWDGKNVSVRNALGKGTAAFPWGTPLCILCGLLRHFFPLLHPYLPSTGP